MVIAGDLIQPVLEETKRLFFPIKSKFWLKLGLVNLISPNSQGGGGGNFSRGMNNAADVSQVTQFIKQYLAVIIAGAGVLFIFGLLWSIIAMTFTFIFLESVITANVSIREGFKRHIKKGFSFFMLNLVIGIVNVIILGLLSLPLIIPVISNIDNLSFSLISIPYLVFFIIFFLIDIFFMILLRFFLYNFVILDMYLKKNIGSWMSFKRMLMLLRAELKEIFFYFLLRIALSIAIGIIAVVIVLALLIPGLIIGVIFALVFVGIAVIQALTVKILLFVIVGLIAFLFFIAWIYAISVVTSPLVAFMYLYAYRFILELNKRNKKLFLG